MNLLALDTSTVACSVAIEIDGDVVARHEEQPREHTRLLMPMIQDVLAESGAELHDLNGIVLGNGPGSFIGMRIAASVAQGLAHGAGLKIVPVSSMAAVAARAATSGHVAVAQDAHMNEVYLGIYELGEGGLVEASVPERLQSQSPIGELEDLPACVAAGEGWHRYPALLAANRDGIDTLSDVLYPDARNLLTLGANAFERGAVAPSELVPAYLRQQVAQRPESIKSV